MHLSPLSLSLRHTGAPDVPVMVLRFHDYGVLLGAEVSHLKRGHVEELTTLELSQ